MPMLTLSASAVAKAQCVSLKSKTDYYDTAITGFILTVFHTGAKVYSLRYVDVYGKQRQYKIGDAKSITFDKARQHAIKLRSRVVLGESPSDERQTLRQVLTFGEFVDQVYLPYVRQHRRNYDSSVSFIKKHILPRFAQLAMDVITPEMIVQAHDSLIHQGYAPATSNRLPIRMKAIYNLALRRKIAGVTSNPAQSIPLLTVNNAKERYLNNEEIQRLYDALEESHNSQLKHIVPLMLLFGCRKRELLDAKWEDVDLKRRNWYIPLSKSGKPRNIPISHAALEILHKLPRFKGCPYVIPNPQTLKPFGNLYHCWNNARKRAGLSDVRMHDLRHSFASNLVNSGHSIYVVSKLLGHTQVKTTQRYSHLSDVTLLSAVDAVGSLVKPQPPDLGKAA
jgi:integrase